MHTKGKWEVGRSLASTGATPVKADFGNGSKITVAWVCCKDTADCLTSEITEANAHRICLCVNTHDDLLAACEAALVYLEDQGCQNWPTAKELKAAIAEAKGE